MSDLEELRKIKEKLELERDIANLKRKIQTAQAIENGIDTVSQKAKISSRWRWYWVAPLGIIGGLITIVALTGRGSDDWTGIFLGIPALTPAILKLIARNK